MIQTGWLWRPGRPPLPCPRSGHTQKPPGSERDRAGLAKVQLPPVHLLRPCTRQSRPRPLPRRRSVALATHHTARAVRTVPSQLAAADASPRPLTAFAVVIHDAPRRSRSLSAAAAAPIARAAADARPPPTAAPSPDGRRHLAPVLALLRLPGPGPRDRPHRAPRGRLGAGPVPRRRRRPPGRGRLRPALRRRALRRAHGRAARRAADRLRRPRLPRVLPPARAPATALGPTPTTRPTARASDPPPARGDHAHQPALDDLPERVLRCSRARFSSRASRPRPRAPSFSLIATGALRGRCPPVHAHLHQGRRLRRQREPPRDRRTRALPAVNLTRVAALRIKRRETPEN